MKDNRVMLAQRACEDLNGKWEFPGGKVEQGETHQAALDREIREELNVKLEIGDLAGSNEFSIHGKKYCLHVYWASITEGEPRPAEHHALTWVPIDQLLSHDLAPADIPIAEKVMKI